MPESSKSIVATAAAATAALSAAVVGGYLLLKKGGGEEGEKKKESSSSETPTAAAEGSRRPSYLLAGDVGGTNARLALHSSDGTKTPLYERTIRNAEVLTSKASNFENDVLEPFLTEAFASVAGGKGGFERGDVYACVAVAGPVISNRAVMTNLKDVKLSDLTEGETYELVIDGGTIERATKGSLANVVTCKLVNDFVGLGYGSLDLDLSAESTEVVELIPGSRALLSETEGGKTGPKACVGAGTGLGECYLTLNALAPGAGYECYPSEGGHTEFAPRSDLEVELLEHLRHKFAQKHRVSVERVVSGKGLANVYEFLTTKFPDKVEPSIHDEFAKAGDMQGRVIGVNSSKGSGHTLCVQAMEIMMGAYGSEVGSAALKFIPTGGMFVAGGLTPKNIDYIRGADSPFLRAYKDKGRVSPVLETVPLFAVMTEDLGLRGARVCAQAVYDAKHC